MIEQRSFFGDGDSMKSSTLVVVSLKNQTRLASLRSSPYQNGRQPDSFWLFPGPLDASIDYASLRGITLLTNESGAGSLIMQSDCEIRAQSLQTNAVTTLTDVGKMAKVSQVLTSSGGVLIVEEADPGCELSKLVISDCGEVTKKTITKFNHMITGMETYPYGLVLTDGCVTQEEIILLDDNGREYRLTYKFRDGKELSMK